MPLSTRPAGPSRIHSSPLVRWLSQLEGAASVPISAPASAQASAPAPAPASLAQGLAPWLGWTDAIALSNVLSTRDTGPVEPACAPPLSAVSAVAAVAAVAAQACQVRADLTQAIRDEPAFFDVQPDAAGLSALRGHVRLHQRAMAARIAPVRARLRQVLAAQGPAGAQLSSLDAVFEQALAARERQLLDTLPGRLTKALMLSSNPSQARQDSGAAHAGHQAHFRAEAEAEAQVQIPDHVQVHVQTQARSHSQAHSQAHSHARSQAHALLLSELAHRLQPVDSLLQALGHASTGAA